MMIRIVPMFPPWLSCVHISRSEGPVWLFQVVFPEHHSATLANLRLEQRAWHPVESVTKEGTFCKGIPECARRRRAASRGRSAGESWRNHWLFGGKSRAAFLLSRTVS